MDAVAGQIGDTELAQVVRRFGDARVLVIGDVMLDRYVSGSAQPPFPGGTDPGAATHCQRAPLGVRRTSR